MPLFKVRSRTESKVTIVAGSVQQLKQIAMTKFKLCGSDASYTICDDHDGTTIDDDECLLALSDFAKQAGTILSLAILQEGEKWSLGSGVDPGPGPVEVTCTPFVDDMMDVEVDMDVGAGVGASVGATVLPSLPYQEITSNLKKALKSPPNVRNMALVRARRNVVKTLAEKLKTKRLVPGTLKKVCSKIHSSCPQAFLISLKEDTSISCLHQFCRALYNALGYVKDVEGIRKQGKRKKSSRNPLESSEDVDDPEEFPFLRVDTNGYSEGMWAPPLFDDDLEQLEENRKTLLDLTSRPSADDDAFAYNLMKTTYALQRHYINGARTAGKWKELVEKWPILQKQVFLLCHANQLLGKDPLATWNGEFSSSDQIFNFFSEYAEKQTCRRAEKMRDYLQTAGEAVASFESVLPRRLALLPLLICYLGDDDNEFLLLVKDPLTGLDEIKHKASQVSKCPLLLVNGLSIFDTQAKAYVIVRGDFVVEVNGVLDGALVVLISYFVFNIVYPKQIARTLEFLQRYFLNISPANSRPNAKVSSLVAALVDHEGRMSRWAS